MFTLAEDSGICVKTLNSLPGVQSAYFDNYTDDEIKSGYLPPRDQPNRPRSDIDPANNRRLLKMMEGKTERDAAFVVDLVLYHPDKGCIFHSQGKSLGYIAQKPKGKNGFGYDEVFIGENTNGLTYAELDSYRKDMRSHRRQALMALSDYVATNLLV